MIQRLIQFSSLSRTRDGVAAANAGEHFPKRVENAVNGGSGRRGVIIGDVLIEHRAFGGGVFAVGFDVDTEVLIVTRLGHLVVLDQPFDL